MLKYTVLNIIIFSSILLRAQSTDATTTRVETALVKLGMQHVTVVESDRRILIGYENTRYRFGPRAMAVVMKTLYSLPDITSDTLTMLVRYRDLPVLVVHTPLWACRGDFPMAAMAVVKADWAFDKWEHLLQKKRKRNGLNSSLFQLDIPIGPGLRYQLGNFDQPIRAAVDVQVGLDMTVFPGLSVQGLLALPVYNNLDDKNKIRVERLALVYDRMFTDRSSVQLSGGFFTLNRAGVHTVGRKWFGDERFSLRLEAGITGFSNIGGPVRFKEQQLGLFPVYLLGAEYWWRRYSLCVRVTGGRFVFQDEGLSMEVFRQMGEQRMGFFVSRTTTGSNMGFNFSVPLFPSTYIKKGNVRLRVADQFPFVYRFRGNERDARRYVVGNGLVDQMYGFYPSYGVSEMWQASSR
jgi:hypothetical protein